MTEVRSYSIPQDKYDLITRFDKIGGKHSKNVLVALEYYLDNFTEINNFSPRFYDDIESWVSYLHILKKRDVKKFGNRLDQIHRIFEDVK